MPITPQVTELWSEDKIIKNQSATRGFLAVNYATGPAAIAAAINRFGLRVGQTHPDDPSMVIGDSSLSVATHQGPTTWKVMANYLYFPTSFASSEKLKRPTLWSILPSLESSQTDQDIHKRPIINSAGTPFPKPEKTINNLVIRARKYFPNYSIKQAFTYQNKVNSKAVTLRSFGTVPDRCMKCTLIAPVSEDIDLNTPAPLEIVFHFEIRTKGVSGEKNDVGFQLRLLDQGYSGWWEDTSGVKHPGDFTEKDVMTGQYVKRTVPTLLDGEGKPIDASIKVGTGTGKAPVPPPPKYSAVFNVIAGSVKGEPSFLQYDLYDYVDFTPLLALLR